MKKTRKRFVSNLIFNIIALISTILALIFCVYIYKLDMIPGKYLTIAFCVIGFIYLILLLFTLPRKIKRVIKLGCCILFIINGLLFGYGIKYSDKTIEALDKISYDLAQKEDYEVKVLSKSNITDSNGLKGKKIGIFKNDSYDDVVKYLKKDIEVTIIDYTDPVKFFEDLQDGTIDGVIASDMVYGLLEDDLSYMKLELKGVHTVAIPVKGEIQEVVKVVDVTNTPFNIFIAGGDKTGSINKVMNTDVNMVISVDPINHKLLLTSIPRDYYVNIPGKGENAYDKLTHAGYYGVQESIRAVEKLLDIEINYYAKVNFTTITKIVDAIGGVDVNSDFNFCKDGDTSICFKRGMNHLSGVRALAFVRERHAFNDGDVQRVKNQQKVIDAIIAKMTSSTSLLSSYTDIMDAISANFSTNLDRKSISRIVKAQLSDMRGWSSESQNLVGTSAMSNKCYSMAGMNLYIMKQDAKSIKSASNKIKEFFGIKESEEEDINKIN